MNREQDNFTNDDPDLLVKQRREALLAEMDFKVLADTPEGRRFLWRLLAECGVHHGSFGTDALSMAYREGRRSIGLFVQNMFRDMPDQYLLMLKDGLGGPRKRE